MQYRILIARLRTCTMRLSEIANHLWKVQQNDFEGRISDNRFLIQKWERELGGAKPNSPQKVQTLVKRLKIIANHLKWQVTDKQKQEIIARYLEGESAQSIARSLGVSQPTLTRYLQEWGIETRNPAAKKQFTDEQVSDALERYLGGESSRSIARSLGVSQPTMVQYLQEWGIKTRNPTAKKQFTDEQISDVIARYLEGESALSISRSLGVSLSTLIRRLKEWGIKIGR